VLHLADAAVLLHHAVAAERQPLQSQAVRLRDLGLEEIVVGQDLRQTQSVTATARQTQKEK